MSFARTNSQLPNTSEINHLPLKAVGSASVLVADVGKAMDAHEIQTNVVRVDGQPSVPHYGLPTAIGNYHNGMRIQSS